MTRAVFQSRNAEVVLPDRTASGPIVQVEYTGEALAAAVICGTARVRVLNTIGASLFGISMRVRGLALERHFEEVSETDVVAAGIHLLGVMMVADLVRGDIIECVLGFEPFPNCVLTTNGFSVVVL